MNYIIVNDILINTRDIDNVKCDFEKCIINFDGHLTSICSKINNPESFEKLSNNNYLNYDDKKKEKINKEEFRQYVPILKRKKANIQYVDCDSRECTIKYNTGTRDYFKTVNKKKVDRNKRVCK